MKALQPQESRHVIDDDHLLCLLVSRLDIITIAKAYREDEAQADSKPPSHVVSDGSLDTKLPAMGYLKAWQTRFWKWT